MPKPRQQPRDDTGYLLLLVVLICVIISIVAALGMVLTALVQDDWALANVPIVITLVVPTIIALGLASVYCLLGATRGFPWMQRHFRWLLWIVFDDDDSAPEPLSDPQSAQAVIGRAVDRLSDTVKDAILDFGVSDEAQPRPLIPPPLPQMERTAFFAAMRPRVDELLSRMADEIDQAPTGSVLDVGKNRLHPLVEELEDEALARGLLLRIDAAYAALPKDRRPQGEWARRYRIMVSAGKGGVRHREANR